VNIIASFRNSSGFRKGFNATDCILVLKEAINNVKSQKKVLVAAFVDFKSGFDKILEKKLCQILKTMEDFPDKFIISSLISLILQLSK